MKRLSEPRPGWKLRLVLLTMAVVGGVAFGATPAQSTDGGLGCWQGEAQVCYCTWIHACSWASTCKDKAGKACSDAP
jgi:hypothetical protein